MHYNCPKRLLLPPYNTLKSLLRDFNLILRQQNSNLYCCPHKIKTIITILLSHPTFTKTSHAHPFAISCSHPKFPATTFQPSPPNPATCTKHSKLHFHHTSKPHLTCFNQSPLLTTSIAHPHASMVPQRSRATSMRLSHHLVAMSNQ